MKKKTILSMLIAIAATAVTQTAFSHAVWTTLPGGVEVNFNIYASKNDVYINGGPGRGAGTNAKGLDPGTYVFMVTDPSGKVLLSEDPATCRQVTVTGGFITGILTPSGCTAHLTAPTEAGYLTVQLMPYADTPNNGGEYKVWLTKIENYTCDINDITIIDCNNNKHGFVSRYSKTDNFKVGRRTAHEIDTRFRDENNGGFIDGLRVEWFDSLGASNRKWSYYDPSIFVNHEAHVEAPEVGIHQIHIDDQPGCKVHEVYVAGVLSKQTGPQVVEVRVTQGMINKGVTTFIDVDCHTAE